MTCSLPTAPEIPAALGVSGRSLVPGVGALLGPATGDASLLVPGVAALLGLGTGVAALLGTGVTSSPESSTDRTICSKILLFGGSLL